MKGCIFLYENKEGKFCGFYKSVNRAINMLDKKADRYIISELHDIDKSSVEKINNLLNDYSYRELEKIYRNELCDKTRGFHVKCS